MGPKAYFPRSTSTSPATDVEHYYSLNLWHRHFYTIKLKLKMKRKNSTLM
jgi:hypothetical protein